MTAPAADAPFSAKIAFYRTQHHTSRGVRRMHLIGVPVIAVAMPLLFARPRVGVPMFLGGWIFQIAGVIHVCEQHGELLSRRNRRKLLGRTAVRVRS